MPMLVLPGMNDLAMMYVSMNLVHSLTNSSESIMTAKEFWFIKEVFAIEFS